MSFSQSTSKSKLGDLPEKDLCIQQVNKQKIDQNQLKHEQLNHNSQRFQSQSSQIINNRTEFLSSLPETSRLLSQAPYIPSHLTPNVYQHLYQSTLPTHYTPPNSDRLASTFNHLALNERLFNPSLSSIISNNSIGTQLNTSESINESIIRRDNEIDRLKMRIMLLEQQIPSSTSIKHQQQQQQQQQNPIELRMKNFELEAAYLRNQLNNYTTNKTTINDLESLLNQREYEIQEMKLKYEQDNSKYEKEIIKMKNLIDNKDEELLKEKAKNSNCQKEIDKLNKKITECNKYISELPTKDEVDQSEQQINEIRNENDNLKQKITDCEKRVNKAKLYIKEKNVEINDLKDKIERLELEKEKCKLEFDNYKLETQSVGELIEKCEQNASLRAELDCAKKLLTSLQDKLKLQDTKHYEKMNELSNELNEQIELNNSLRIDLENKQNLIFKLEKKLNESTNDLESLEADKCVLNEKIKSLETALSNDSLKMLKLLFKHLNKATNDLDILVNACVNIYYGKPFDVCSLLGTADQIINDNNDVTKNESVLSIINTEFMQEKIESLKDMRNKLDKVKNMITDEYADKFGSNMSCAIH